VSNVPRTDPLDCRYCARCKATQPVYPDIVDGVDELRCQTCGKAHKRGRVNTKMSGQDAAVYRRRE
jgi:flavoprotein